jgi:hypothetical protein
MRILQSLRIKIACLKTNVDTVLALLLANEALPRHGREHDGKRRPE